MKVAIELDEEEIALLEKRAKKNLMTLREQIEDILRRSCVMCKTQGSSRQLKIDDKLVAIFSRERRGRKSKKKKLKKK